MVGKVLHVGTGMPRTMIVTVDSRSGPRAYVGLVSSYYERITDKFQRLNDKDGSTAILQTPCRKNSSAEVFGGTSAAHSVGKLGRGGSALGRGAATGAADACDTASNPHKSAARAKAGRGSNECRRCRHRRANNTARGYRESAESGSRSTGIRRFERSVGNGRIVRHRAIDVGGIYWIYGQRIEIRPPQWLTRPAGG